MLSTLTIAALAVVAFAFTLYAAGRTMIWFADRLERRDREGNR